METLLKIWPSLGQGYVVAHTPRNLSYTKKGPGRRHNKKAKNKE